MRNVSRSQARKLVGKSIYAMRRDGSVVTGKLVKVRGDRLYLASNKRSKGKKAKTSFWILPLVLFDLLAIGTLPFWGGGWGGGYGGCGCGVPTCGGCGYGGGYGGYGPNGGYPGGYFNGY
ncbi:hypothetical protein [Paenibacillus soyae]|uniref:50S ribosomal protein L33 n=1 Tax=Paenibacillus soyae TaxID=2969249 RepID=A0A9X2S6M2_9BACL|nr:hypothetical protein [Paenibacillus soyae]MCR2802384.1 hypothetical protein [Paenibacillus soyae]